MSMALLGLSLCACSDDDDNDVSGSAPISIPASVVDGVRVSQLSGNSPLEVTYNDDGTIAKAEFGENEFVFEYEPSTRGAVATGRALKQVVASRYDDTHQSKHIANGFSFNTDGFLVKYQEESIEETSYGSYGSLKETIKYDAVFSYNSKGRLQNANFNGSWTSVETYEGETEKESGKGSGAVNFSYKGDVLEKSTITSDGETQTYAFGYTSASPSNYYNITTPQMAEAMSFGSPILFVLAMTGYLGNASATLPSTYQRIYISDEDEENDVETFTVTYNMWDNTQRVKDVKMYDSYGNQVYYCGYNYSIR